MTAPNPARQKARFTTVDRIFADAANVWVTHYSCESFYERPQGRSPRITSIAVRKLDPAQTISLPAAASGLVVPEDVRRDVLRCTRVVQQGR